MRRLVAKEEAAEYLGVTLRHLRDLCYRREVPFVKVGGALRFDVKALDRYIDEHTTEAVR